MTTAHDFGPRLKARREQQGIRLESISDATKIGLPLLEGLERSDVSHWPKGIFRRAFFRDYAGAIGVPVEDMLAEFLQLFPEEGRAGVEPCSPDTLRMTLAIVRSPVRVRVLRVVAALADAGIVVLLGLAAAWWLAVDRSMAVAVTGLLYYPLTTGWLGRGLALSWLQDDRLTINRAWRTAPRRAEDASVTTPAASESVRQERRVAGFLRDRRTGVDRRRAPRLIHEPEPAPIAGVFGSAQGLGDVIH
jgi:transcriptional regulator with XRE-family HTH domain